MTKLLMLTAILLTGACVSAQKIERIIVKAGEDISPAISPAGHYHFARFTEGIVTMKNGSRSRARLNFHICNGEMQFIDAKGDTLAIAQAELVDNINIGTDTKFTFSDKAYYEIVGESSAGKLGKRIKVQLANDKKTAFGQSDPIGSQLQIGEIMFAQRTVTLSYDVEVRKTTTYYWMDSKRNVFPATQKNVLKLVEKEKQAKLQAFMTGNKTNFNNEEELTRLLAFAATL